MKEVTELLHITNLHKNPDGSKKYPALNCRDLRMFHPNLKSGELFFICQTFRNYSHPSQHHPLLQLYHFVLLLKKFVFLSKGYYWIDPNGGAIEDAVLVECDVETNSTCFPAKAQNVS